MKKGFILACIAAFILLFEDLNHLIVILVVSDLEAGQAWSKAFRGTSIESILFVGGFRLVPFISLGSCAIYTNLLTHMKGKVSLWVGFVVATSIVFIGYWGITEPLYTDAHASSTSALSYIWVPIAAAVYSMAACAITYLIFWLVEVVSKRK